MGRKAVFASEEHLLRFKCVTKVDLPPTIVKNECETPEYLSYRGWTFNSFHKNILDFKEMCQVASDISDSVGGILSSDDHIEIADHTLRLPAMIFGNDVMSLEYTSPYLPSPTKNDNHSTIDETQVSSNFDDKKLNPIDGGCHRITISIDAKDSLCCWAAQHTTQNEESTPLIIVQVPCAKSWNERSLIPIDSADIKSNKSGVISNSTIITTVESDKESNEVTKKNNNNRVGKRNIWDWTFSSDYCCTVTSEIVNNTGNQEPKVINQGTIFNSVIDSVSELSNTGDKSDNIGNIVMKSEVNENDTLDILSRQSETVGARALSARANHYTLGMSSETIQIPSKTIKTAVEMKEPTVAPTATTASSSSERKSVGDIDSITLIKSESEDKSGSQSGNDSVQSFTGKVTSSIIKNDYTPRWMKTKSSGINFNLLRMQDVPILYYDEILLYQDDLEDCGDVTFDAKLRVMPACWFILSRFFMRVDGAIVRIRDTRLFHCFGEKFVHMEVTWKEQDLSTEIGKEIVDRKLTNAILRNPALCAEKISAVNEKEGIHSYYVLNLN